jgi:hypothetical protein
MFDSVLAHFVRQLGAARFSVDRSALVVRFAGRPAVRVALSSDEASSLVKAARDLANTVEAIFPPAASSLAAPAAIVSTPEAPPSAAPAADAKPTPAKPKSPAKK